MAQYHVYGIGNALVDMEFQVTDDDLAKLAVDKGLMTLIEEDRHHDLMNHLAAITGKKGSGGSAANTIIACAQLGGDTYYSCKVANDETGTFYMHDLAQCGVKSNLSLDNRQTGVTGKCIVMITPDAERSMNTYLGITREISEKELDIDAIQNSEYIYIEGYLVPEPAARRAAVKAREIAQESGVKTALTLSDANMVNYFKDGLLEITGDGLDLMFSNEDEAKLMFDASSINECVEGMKGLARQFAITRGAKGAVLFDGIQTIEIPAEQVKPVDTNGAGDMYAGAFLYGLTQGMSIERCGELAGTAAASLITQFGARLPQTDMDKISQQYRT